MRSGPTISGFNTCTRAGEGKGKQEEVGGWEEI